MIYEVADPDSQWWHTQWQWQAQQGQLWWQAQWARSWWQAQLAQSWWQAQLAQSWWQGQTSPASGASSEWFSDDVVMVTAWRLHGKAREASRAMEGVEGLAKAKSLMDDIAWAAATESIAQPATNAMAAQALWDVDGFMLTDIGSQHPEIKAFQKLATDVLILACARHIPEADLEGSGLPQSLMDSLSFALGFDLTQNGHLHSRLGTSKYKVFTRGAKYYSRPAKPSRLA